jgi:hypothetical protein
MMNPTNYDIDYQWGKGPRNISTRQEFAAVIRGVTGTCTSTGDSCYPVYYDFQDCETTITGFKIVSKWIEVDEKYGYWFCVEGTKGFFFEQETISDCWTAKIRLCEYLGCTEKEINDIFWNGKSREEIDCPGCPCNRIEGKEGR